MQLPRCVLCCQLRVPSGQQMQLANRLGGLRGCWELLYSADWPFSQKTVVSQCLQG